MTHSGKLEPGALLMSLDTAAARYEISRKTIERMIRAGRLTPIKIGAATRLNIKKTDEALIGATNAEEPPHG